VCAGGSAGRGDEAGRAPVEGRADRGDVFLGLLDGRFHGLTEDQIVAALLRDPRPEDTPAKEASSENTAASGSAAGGAPGAAGEVPVASASGAEGGDGPAEAEVDDADSEGQNGTGSGIGTGTGSGTVAAELDIRGPAGGVGATGIEVNVGLTTVSL
jgi:hypothetical protein